MLTCVLDFPRFFYKGDPGSNAKRLASIIASTVLAGELSLTSALASNHLVSAHLALNRKTSAHPPPKRTSHRMLNSVKVPDSVGPVRPFQATDPKQQEQWTTPRLTVP